MKSSAIFVPLVTGRYFTESTAVNDFFKPSRGLLPVHEPRGFCFMGGINYAGIRQQKARTRGRSILAKCSPKERDTLPRGPIPQKQFSRPTNAVITLGLSIDAQYATQWKNKGRSRHLVCPSHSPEQTRNALQ